MNELNNYPVGKVLPAIVIDSDDERE
jgi:hypothetical protein